MSANNQTLVKEHKGKFYVFTNVNAESWVHYDEKTGTFDDTRRNELKLKGASAVFENRDDAFNKAWELDEDDDMGGTEYGVQFNRLCKDDGEIKIIE